MCLSQIFEFTQRDIDSNSVLFRHRKGGFGRFVFWVRDGKHVVPGNLWPGSYRFLPVLEYIALKATSTRLSLLVVNNSYRRYVAAHPQAFSPFKRQNRISDERMSRHSYWSRKTLALQLVSNSSNTKQTQEDFEAISSSGRLITSWL